MTTLSEQTDAQIKSLQEQLNSSQKEHKEEKTIDEQIERLQKEVESKPERKTIEEQIEEPQKQSSQAEQIDEMIQKLQKQLNESKPIRTIYDELRDYKKSIDEAEPKPTTVVERINELHTMEKDLRDKINRKTAIIKFLTTQLETAIVEKQRFEDQVTDIKITILKICNN